MNQRPRVSIVIPAYNEENQIRTCLQSIAAQTVQPFEVIIVDNNSADKTVAEAKKFPFVKVIKEPRKGSVFASTAGLNYAEGEIIARIDADTHLAPDWVEVVSDYFVEHKEIAAITGKCYFRDFPFRRAVSAIHASGYHYLQKLIAGSEVLWGSNMAIRRDAWLKVRSDCQLRPDVDEDIDLSIHLKNRHLRARRILEAHATVSLRRGDIGPVGIVRYLKTWPKNYLVNKEYFRAAVICLFTIVFLVLVLPASAVYSLFRQR